MTRIAYRTSTSQGPEQSPLEQKYRNLLQTRFQAIGFGIAPDALAKLDAEIAALKERIEKPSTPRKPSGKPQERDILKAILQLLSKHPKVARVWRQNSGTFSKQYGNKTHYIRANTAKGMSDIMGVLKDGRTLCVEVKSPTGIVHAHQHEFLNSIAAAGGVAFVARSLDDVITKLEGV